MNDYQEYGYGSERVKFSDLRSEEKDAIVEELLERLGLDILLQTFDGRQVRLIPKD